MNNSRMKDFFDLWAIATTFEFDGALLASAVAATFAKRGTPLPGASPPVAFTPAFANDSAKQAQWTAFIRRTQIAMAPAPFPDLLKFVASFATPLFADAAAALASSDWKPGGPWAARK